MLIDRLSYALIATLVFSGCMQGGVDDPAAGGSQAEAGDPAIGVSEQALNNTSAFQLGLQVIDYVGAGDTTPTWFSVINVTPHPSGSVTSVSTPFTGIDTGGGHILNDPSGIQIKLIPDPNHNWGVPNTSVDFRLGIQAEDSSADRGNVRFTPWASEIGSFSTVPTIGAGTSLYATKAYPNNMTSPAFYRLIVEARLWPNPSRDLLDIAVGVSAIGPIPGANCLFGCTKVGPYQFTNSLSRGGGWSNVARSPTEGTTRAYPALEKQLGMSLDLVVQYVDH